jgi:hypothetical protein
MGIDVYMRWKEQTEDERKAQYTGFSIAHGHIGYLREAYHGGPYATKVLFPEGWMDGEYDNELGIPIKAITLRERLPATIIAAIERASIVYHEEIDENAPEVKAFKDFVELAERVEANGKQVYIYVSA